VSVVEDRILASSESEQAALGAVLLDGNQGLEALADLRLRPDHFYWSGNRRIFESMQRVYDAGGSVDRLTVTEDLRRHGNIDEAGGEAAVEGLAAAPPVSGNVRDYGRRVRVLAGLREEITAAQRLIEANMREDSDYRQEALAGLMDSGDADDDQASTPDDLAELVADHIGGGGAQAMPLPFSGLNDDLAGGLHPGCLTLLGGHSSHGKSAMADQIGHFLADQGYEVWAYINEMTRLQRACRMAAKLAGVDAKRVIQGKLSKDETLRVMKALPNLPFGMTEAIGWSAADIARDMRRHRRTGLVVVDLLHEIDYLDEKELARACRTLARAAKLCGCHVLATVHLSEKRVEGARRKPPTLGEIRDSGSLKNIADNVAFIWRKQDEKSGFPKEDGWLYFAKVRSGDLCKQAVWFEGSTMTFKADHSGYGDLDLEED
jgi:replicative DNA helicase